MTTPVSVNNGLFTTNTLASKKFLLIYLFIIWSGLLTLALQFYIFWSLLKDNPFLFLLCLPIEIIFSYLIVILSSTIVAKVLLSAVNLIHTPREGIFLRKKTDKDYYYWSLRNVIKKWPVWLSNFSPSPVMDKILLTLFGVEMNDISNLNGVTLDTEFISIGKNVSIGAGTYVRSSMIISKFLIIKRIVIKENVNIGPQSFISPGTRIGENVFVNASSLTKVNQNLQSNRIYGGYPAKMVDKRDNLNWDDENSSEKEYLLNVFNKPNEKIRKKFEGRFATNIPQYLLIFFLIYIFSYGIPFYSLTSFIIEIFYPYFLNNSGFFSIFITPFSLYVVLFTPLILIGLYLFNLFLVAIITKIMYLYIERYCPFQEGVYNWQEKTKEYDYYFIRSFLIRYIKWRCLKSPFPWLLAPFFNFIGNCYIGKNSVIEDLYMAKEYVWIGDDVYLGNILLANHYWDKNLTVKGIKIEDNAVICDGCCIGPGSYIQKNATLLPLSITTKSDIMKSDEFYHNIPIKKMKSAKIIDFFDLNSESSEMTSKFKKHIIKTTT